MAMVQTFPTGSSSGSGSNNGFYKTTDSITATIDATTTLDITNISGLSISDVIIGETIVYDNQGTNAVVTAKDTTNNTIDVKTISMAGTINYNVDRSGQELLSAYAKLNSSWTATVNSNAPLVLKSGNITQPSTGLFTIPAETRIEIIFSTSSNPVGDTSYSLYNNTDSAYISDITNIDPYKGDNYFNSTVLSAQWTNNTGHSVDISIRASRSSATSILIGHTSLTIKEIGRIVDPIQYTANNDELEETPVGNIISYMGNSVPKHHLACDGTEYAIGTYPELEAHIIKEFGSINYFGGDGTTTWAVPDLNGEFLRGTGTNSHTNQGSGASVGEHQDATKHSYIQFSNAGIWGSTGISNNHDFKGNITTGRFFGTTITGDNQISYFTSRPTNTSVKFCIKYESTYHVIVPSHMYKVNIPFSTVASSASVYATFDSTNIIGDTSLVDTTNNQFIAPMHGWYSVSFNTSQGSSRKCPAIYLEKYEGGTKIEEIAMVNGFNTGDTYYSGTISTTVYLKKNQAIKYRVHNTGALSGEASFCLLTANYKDNIIAGGEVYSFDEQVIGTWKDGKPLYQKTFKFTMPKISANLSTATVDVDISSLNADTCFIVSGYTLDSDSSTHLFGDDWIPTIKTSHHYFLRAYVRMTSNVIRCAANSVTFSEQPGVITIQYTKTTDQANTYQYKNSLLLTRPDMWEPNAEYDFGGGLYGQRFTGTVSLTAHTWASKLLTSFSSGTTVAIISSGGGYFREAHDFITGYLNADNLCTVYIDDNELRAAFVSYLSTNAPYDIWVTYTK